MTYTIRSPEHLPGLLSTEESHVKTFKPTYLATGLLVLAIVLWMVSGVLLPNSNSNESEATNSAEKAQQALMKVEVTELFPTPVERKLTLQGQIRANRELSLRAKTTGSIESILVSRGDRVAAGTVIAKLSNDGRSAQLLEAKARISTATSEQKAAARLQKQGLQSQLNAQRADAELAAAQATLERIELEITRTEIRAPFAGVINNLPVEIGQSIDAGSVIADIVDDTTFRVSANVAQQSVHQLESGQNVSIKLINGTELTGKLDFISAVADDATRSFEVEAIIENPDQQIAAGISATLYIPVESVDAVFVSPSAIALGENGDIGIKSVDADNIVHFYPINIVQTNSDGAWVTGIPAGTRVITLGQGFVNAGQQVEPVLTAEQPASATTNNS